MNILPIFSVLQQSAEVVSVLGSRIYEDIAPSKTPYPFAVWSSVGGVPDNQLADQPQIDHISFQIVVYDEQATRASNIRKLIARILGEHCYVTGTHPNHYERIADTDVFGRGFDGNWWLDR